MEDRTFLTGNHPTNGISNTFRQFIEALVEEVVINGEPFDAQKKWLHKHSEREGISYETMESNLSDLFEAIKELEEHESRVIERSVKLLARESYLSEALVSKILDNTSSIRAKKESERKAQEEKERKEREEAERKAKEETERKAKEESEKKQTTGELNGHEWIDLGLPSGTLWATCNVGANKPEDYGEYFAWGETEPKTTYSELNYNYRNRGRYSLTKYCNKPICGDNGFTDSLTELQRGDDPASTWGSGWQTPSYEQWEELLANTAKKWTTQNGVKGRLFTSKKNGQTLFLPAAGVRSDSYLYYAGSDASYWSSSLDTSDPHNAWFLYFSSGDYVIRSYNRFCGRSVRAVRSARQN